MTPFMTGKGKTPEQRKMDMCVGAKICSGKAATEAEAQQICINQPPKEPKAKKVKGSIDTAGLATCVARSVELKDLTAENFPGRLETAITHCSTGEAVKPVPRTYNRFMTSCLKEAGVGEDFSKNQPSIRDCQAKWNATREA